MEESTNRGKVAGVTLAVIAIGVIAAVFMFQDKPDKKLSGLSGKKFGPRKLKKKTHSRKGIEYRDTKIRYNSHWKKYQVDDGSGTIEEFKTIDEAKKYVRRHGSARGYARKHNAKKKSLSGPGETKQVTAKFIYEDDWSQKVYKGSDGKKYVEVDGQLHTMTSEGEANYPVKHVTKLDGAKKLSKHDAKQKAIAAGIDFSKDFHELSSSQVAELISLAKQSGYQKSKSASASRGNAYFHYLQKVK